MKNPITVLKAFRVCSYERGRLGDLASYVNGGNVIRAPCRYYGEFDGPLVGQGRAISHILTWTQTQ